MVINERLAKVEKQIKLSSIVIVIDKDSKEYKAYKLEDKNERK